MFFIHILDNRPEPPNPLVSRLGIVIDTISEAAIQWWEESDDRGMEWLYLIYYRKIHTLEIEGTSEVRQDNLWEHTFPNQLDLQYRLILRGAIEAQGH